MSQDFRVLYGDATATIRRELPESFDSVTAGEITIYDTGGTELVAATAVTVPTATTLASAVTAGEKTCTVAGGTWEPGDILRIEDSNSGPPEDFEVESFNATSKVITSKERFQYAHANAAAVSARWVTYVWDVSTTATYTNLLEGTFEWATWTPDNPGITNSWVISKRELAVGGLEHEFANLYPHYYAVVEDDAWGDFEQNAYIELEQNFAPYGQDFMNLISTRAAKRLLMVQIAYLIAWGQGSVWESERTAMHTELDRLITLFKQQRNWFDTDQDLAREDEEWQSLAMPLPRRGFQ
jgi:hypothetical protein